MAFPPYAFSRAGVIRYAILVIILSFLLIGQSAYEMRFNENVASVKMGSYVLSTLMHVCLLVGAYRNSRGMLLPYLILKCLGLSVLVVIGVTYMFSIPITTLLILLFVCAINIAVWIGVFGFYKKLEIHSNTPTAPGNNEFDNKVYDQPPPYEKV